MLRRLPLILGSLASLAVLLFVGPVAVAVMLLRSSSDAEGPHPAAQIFIALLVLALTVSAFFLVSWLTRLVLRLSGRG